MERQLLLQMQNVLLLPLVVVGLEKT